MTTQLVDPASSVVELDPELISVPKDRRRKPIDTKNEKDLHFIDNIRRLGFLQAIEVREVEGPKPYELIFGQRRLAVAKLLGILVPARVVPMSDDEVSFIATSENMMRRHMEYGEYIKALKTLMDDIERLYGADPGKANNNASCRNRQPRGGSGQFGSVPRIEPAPPPVGAGAETPPSSSPGELDGGHKEESPARSHQTLASEVTGASKAKMSEDLKVANAFTQEEVDLMRLEGVQRREMVHIAHIEPKEARSLIVTRLAQGHPVEDAVKAGLEKAAELKEAAKKPPPPPKEQDLSDADWLRTWCAPVRNILQDPQYFDADALLYRQGRIDAGAFRVALRERAMRAKAKNGPLAWLWLNAMYVEHPSKWYICADCLGKNHEHPECKACRGTGYKLKFDHPKK